MLKSRNRTDRIVDIIIILVMLTIVVVMVYPLWNTLITSFNDSRDSIKGGLYFWPREWTLFNYQSIFKNEALFKAFGTSVARTLITTVFGVMLCGLLAYVLSRKDFMFRKQLTIFMVMTMYINAGLIPQFILYRDLGLYNSFWVYVFPSLVGAFNVIVLRTYINSLPDSLVESAKIDGAGELMIYFRIIFPLTLPAMATIALWIAVGQWNSWFDSYVFAPHQSLSTLQFEMMKIISSSMQSGARQPDYLAASNATRDMVTPNSLRAAMTIVATVPILCIYPFLQKYFVTVNIGSVKE